MEALRTSKNPIVWYQAGGFDEARVVHDGRLLNKPSAAPVTEAEKTLEKEIKAEARKLQRLAALKVARSAKANKES
jgi:hypothetical protein